MSRSLWIESSSRWDALALVRKLGRYHWFLVEPDAQHWDVHVSLDGPGEALPSELAERVLEWLDERDLEAAKVHVAQTEVVLTRHGYPV